MVVCIQEKFRSENTRTVCINCSPTHQSIFLSLSYLLWVTSNTFIQTNFKMWCERKSKPKIPSTIDDDGQIASMGESERERKNSSEIFARYYVYISLEAKQFSFSHFPSRDEQKRTLTRSACIYILRFRIKTKIESIVTQLHWKQTHSMYLENGEKKPYDLIYRLETERIALHTFGVYVLPESRWSVHVKQRMRDRKRAGVELNVDSFMTFPCDVLTHTYTNTNRAHCRQSQTHIHKPCCCLAFIHWFGNGG